MAGARNCRNRKGCHPLREFPYDDANITLYFGIKAIEFFFGAQKYTAQTTPYEIVSHTALWGSGRDFISGSRIRDLLSLTWEQLLNENDKFVIYEKKTNKRRTIKINTQFKPHILACYEAIHPRLLDRPCFISQKHAVYSVPIINVLPFHFSTQSLVKTFGRKIFELASSQGQGELALIKLSELFNHSNASITRIHLGIKEEEMLSTYDMLEF